MEATAAAAGNDFLRETLATEGSHRVKRAKSGIGKEATVDSPTEGYAHKKTAPKSGLYVWFYGYSSNNSVSVTLLLTEPIFAAASSPRDRSGCCISRLAYV